MASPGILERALKTGVKKLSPREFGDMVQAIHKRLGSKVYGRKNAAIYRPVIGEQSADVIGPTTFLGCSSAKVVHSAVSSKWLNVVLYHAPSDEALLSFWKEHAHDRLWVAEKLIANVEQAAAKSEAWRALAPYRKETLKKFHEQYDKVTAATKMDPDYSLPDAGGLIRPLNVCPFASPNCRALCLNSSGQAATPTVRKDDPIWESYNRLRASGLKEGYTKEDDFQYLYLRGRQAMYGGMMSEAKAARLRRTHLMWLIWAQQGCIENVYNDILYHEAMRFKAIADRLKIPMALRLNGTSDIPVHTLRLKNVTILERGKKKSLAGANLIQELGKRGIVCYDYTKDYQRMKSWMQTNNWTGADPVVAKGAQPTVRKGWPSNYYMCFSWSEVNGELALNVLRMGGNVVMVFRRSMTTGKKDPYQVKTTARSRGYIPETIRVSDLSKRPEYRNWWATVIDGDMTDLRFDDGHHVGKRNGGVVVGLVAKGKAQFSRTSYTPQERRKLWRIFSLPITLEKTRRGLAAILRKNPAKQSPGALIYADTDLYDQTTANVDGYHVTTTAAGT